ncbi:ATP-binding protein [Phaeacidiphilus oryzae]|uniref:ATP-binding protein n=1 Tax=Phaeacidiphilus oryzae TaxID=348818 RepID=UPI00056C7D69|nr:ATP-binding protein [Phaeacidiphilus oryzae]
MELPGGRIASSPARPSLQLLLSLPAVLSSVPYARTQLRRAVRLRCPDADPELLLQAALVVDELMANAVTHGSAHALGAEAPSVTLGLSLIPVRRLRIAVRDQGGGWPLPLGAPPRRSTAPDPPLEREDGRGLMLVQEFAERWGTFPAGGGTPHGCAPPAPESQDAALPDRGTVVWAVVPL